MKKIILLLQLIFFGFFVFTLYIPILTNFSYSFSFMKLSFFSYIAGIKLTLISYAFIIILLLELIGGRIFCGFICPLGNFISFTDWVFKKLRIKNYKFKTKKFFLLIPGIILIILLFFYYILKINIIGFMDPISIINRFFTTTLSSFFKSDSVPLINIITILFLFIISLSILGERIWCKYICPVGFIHKLLSIKPLYKRKVKECNNCNLCISICPMEAININNPKDTDFSQCILCGKCINVCPGKTIFDFTNKKNNNNFSSNRRNFIKLSLFSLIFLNLKNDTKSAKTDILRPPGATSNSILRYCLRCMECIKVCPTNVLQPIGIKKGIIHLYTPEFRTDLSYCDYECNLCSKICPNFSIKKLTLKEKQKWQVGIAKVDRTQCWPWSKDIPCLVCEEHCPVPEKAIKLKPLNKEKGILAPIVTKNLCIGCGICQIKCPVEGAAIKVFPI